MGGKAGEHKGQPPPPCLLVSSIIIMHAHGRYALYPIKNEFYVLPGLIAQLVERPPPVKMEEASETSRGLVV